MSYAIYDAQTGFVRAVISGPLSDVEANIRPGEGYVEASRGDADLYFVDLATGDLMEKPARPSLAHQWDLPTQSWIASDSNKWALVRCKRNELLAQSDWTTTRALETTGALDPAWVQYRQALRDVTLQADPDSVVWPAPPS